jgi:hypothetical protein
MKLLRQKIALISLFKSIAQKEHGMSLADKIDCTFTVQEWQTELRWLITI